VAKKFITSRLPLADGSEEAPAMVGGEIGAVRSASAPTPARSTAMSDDSWLGELWCGMEEV
jgi:hypothetical protein